MVVIDVMSFLGFCVENLNMILLLRRQLAMCKKYLIPFT